MIKRVTLATRRPDLTPEAFAARWPEVVAPSADAPDGLRPVRVAACTALADLSDPGAPDGLALEWFADDAHLAGWDGACGGPARAALDEVAQPGSTRVVLVDEVVVRGAGWLDRHRAAGGEALEHLALATRAPGLTAAAFSARWRAHAGQAGSGAAAVAIPEAVRGRAYVQDHPRPRAEGEWAFDALTEVWFDDEEGLRARVAWFRQHRAALVAPDLFAGACFLAAREVVLT